MIVQMINGLGPCYKLIVRKNLKIYKKSRWYYEIG